MAGLTASGRARMTIHARLGGMPTGPKIFLILSAALLPLVVIAFLVTLYSTRQAGEEARSHLRVALQESKRNLAIELVGDMTALTSAMKALAVDPGDTPSCARVQGVFAQQSATGAAFMIVDRQDRLLCGSRLAAPLPDALAGGGSAPRILPGKGIILAVADAGGTVKGGAFFPVGFLADIARPTGFAADYEETLSAVDTDPLTLRAMASRSLLDLPVPMRTGLGIGNLSIEMRMRANAITSPILIAMLLPLLMWAAAAVITWFVVSRLLIRPLKALRTAVASYKPGEAIDAGLATSLPAQEIRELGETFRSLSRTLVLHEAGLAEGLVRQTKLTREVHHRVKNNLQVISSLINLHSRGSPTPEAAAAYASIQRRVDALSVVHRHHFAEMEDHRGLSLRAVIGELASNIRATTPPDSGLTILLEVEPWLASQDTAIAVAFLLTELIELAMAINPATQLRLSVRAGETADSAIVRVSAPALIDSEALTEALSQRYGRVLEGLSRQIRSKLHHDPLAGSYEIAVPVSGRD